MAAMDADSIDAVVADPPYGIGFMGHEWDQPGEYGPVRGNGTPQPFAETTGERALEDRIKRSQRRGSQRGPAAGAGHRRDREAAAAGEPPRPDAMQAGRYDLAPEAMRRFQAWCEAWGAEMLRVVKPGGHALVFGGTRTYHRMVAGLEDAGWEVRDCLVWAYASGFPKSLDVSKAIDRAAGLDRGVNPDRRNGPNTNPATKGDSYMGHGAPTAALDDGPASPGAVAWQGWGTALKPAWEPIVLLRKPFRGTVAANVLERGTGALNIDGARIPIAEGDVAEGGAQSANGRGEAVDYGPGGYDGTIAANTTGRWPANVVLTDPVFDGEFPDDVVGGGYQAGGGNPARLLTDGTRVTYGKWTRDAHETGKVPVDTEGAYSRFFKIGGDGCYLCGRARSVPESSDPASDPTGSAPDRARTEASSDDDTETDRPTTNATESPSSPPGSGPMSGSEPSPATSPEPPSPSNPASRAGQPGTSSATTTTTVGPWTCDSCAALATRLSMVARASDGTGSYPWAFLIPKAGRVEREPVVRGQVPTKRPPGWSSGDQAPGTFQSQPTPARENTHPTVKPLALIRHLVRLVTPPDGIVLDPFLGSGTTALAAESEGFRWVGIEREPEYVAMAEARLEGHARGLGLDVGAPAPKRTRSKGHWPAKRSPHAAEGWGFAGGQEGLLERVDGEP